MAENKLISLQLERNALGGLIKNPQVFAEIDSFITPDVFADADNIHAVIFSVIRKTLSSGTTDKIDKVLLAQEINNLGLRFNSDVSIFDYVNNLSFTQATPKSTLESFKQLLKLKLGRDLFAQTDVVKDFIIKNINEPIDVIIEGVDSLNNEKIAAFAAKSGGVKDIFEDLEPLITNIAANPPDPNKFLYGPFPTVNRIYGSLHRPGNITMLGARSGIGKSSLSMFYNIYLAEKYDIPVLHMDNGEMSEEELLFRVACMFTKNKISVNQLENGTWPKFAGNKEIMAEAFKRAKKVKFYYKNVSGLSPIETISFHRRFYYNKIGRGNQLITNYDYFKAFDTTNVNTPDWRELGMFVQQIKSYLTTEVNLPWWANIQLNKAGITRGMTSDKVVINESSFNLSDRVYHQTSHAFILRPKLSDELAAHTLKFGNMILSCVKHRHLGEDYFDALNKVEVTKGKYEDNYINLQNNSFYFDDKGDLRTMIEDLKLKAAIEDHNKKDEDDGHL